MTAGSIDTSSAPNPSVATDALDDTPRPADAAEPTRLSYLPGLDGLRALAVLAVMVGHLPYNSRIVPEWLVGSWLGVSTFFTLSGFLITRLLLTERARTGSVSLGDFWTRRARRLLPALYTAIAFLLLLSVLKIAPPDREMGSQVLALVLYFKNGLLLYLHGENGPTFFQMWSLSIEEQFYLLFPLLFLGASLWLRRRAWAVFAGLLVASQLWMIHSNRRGTFAGYVSAYFGTPARSAELLAGVLLAYVVTSAWWRRSVADDGFTLFRQVIGVAGLIGLLLLFRNAQVTWDQTFRWTIPTSLATVAIIVGCTTTGGAASFLSVRPLRWIGKVSYGAYVYHLGVYFLVTSGRTGIQSDFGLSVVRYVATFVVAGLSYRYIEAPLRHRTTPRGWRLAVAYGSVGLLLVGAAYLLPFHERGAVKRAVVPTGTFAATNAAAADDATAVVVISDRGVGQSVAGLERLVRTAKDGYTVRAITLPGCPVAGLSTLVLDGQLRGISLGCTLWQMGRYRPAPGTTVQVVQLGAADLLDQRLRDGTFTHLGRAAGDSWLRDGLVSLARANAKAGARTVLVALPPDPASIDRVRLDETRSAGLATAADVNRARLLGTPTDAELRGRIARFNDIIRSIADERPDVTVVEPLTTAPESWREAVGPGNKGR